ncbi:hemolysin secretion protein D, partial [Francisella tularensis subsp. holarctica]|nr:hemolysin secretion protein D [Francisella tularensis subsp. holarctica]
DLTKDSLIVEKRNFERYRILKKEGAVSAQQKDLAEKSLISSESQYIRACQNVDKLKIRQNDLLSEQKIKQSKIDQKQY